MACAADGRLIRRRRDRSVEGHVTRTRDRPATEPGPKRPDQTSPDECATGGSVNTRTTPAAAISERAARYPAMPIHAALLAMCVLAAVWAVFAAIVAVRAPDSVTPLCFLAGAGIMGVTGMAAIAIVLCYTHARQVAAWHAARTDDAEGWRLARTEADTMSRLIDGILRHVPLSIQVKDHDLRFRWANPAFGRAMSIEPAAMLGKSLHELPFPAAGVARAHAMDREVLTTGETVRFDERWVVNGTVHNIVVVKAPLLDADGGATHVITIGADVTELHRLRTESEETRRVLQLVLDAVPMTIAMKDTERRFQWVNRAFERVHDCPSADILGHTAEEFVADPTLTASSRHADESLLATGKEQPPIAQRIRQPDRPPSDWSVSRLPLRGANGAIEGILVVGMDVTALRQANEDIEARAGERARELTRELAQINELMAKVLQAAPVPIVTWRGDGQIVGWNPAAVAVTGYTEAEALAGLIPPRAPEDQARFDVNWAKLLEGQTITDSEARWLRKDGQARELLVSAAPLHRADGTIDGAVGIWLDVTERNKTERELAAVRDNLLDAMESIDHAIVLYDRDDRIVLFNHHHLDHYRAIADMIAPGVRYEDRLRAAVERGLIVLPDGMTGEAFVTARVRDHQRADATKIVRRHTNGRAYEVWEARARSGGIVNVAVEVTERLRLEQQLLQAQKMEAIGQLTGGIAHDFNNLLAVVIGNLDLLALHLPPESESRALADQAIEAAERGAALTGRLLAFARRQTLRPVATNVAALVQGMEPLLRRAVGETIEVRATLDADVWPALIDPSQLESAILNLAVNARDAMPNGGTLRLKIANALPGTRVGPPQTGAGPEEETQGDFVRVAVADTGSGMPPDILAQVFEPFFSTKDIGKGSGLGLSMVFGFVRQSGGHVRIDSEVGLGTTVALLLPRATAAQDTVVPEMNVEEGAGETILLVEDNASLRQAAANMVQALGYRVLTAETGGEALALAADHPEMDLLFTDVVLPGGMNGFELARQFRDRGLDIPVVFTSGFADPSVVSRDWPEPSTPILTKPYRGGGQFGISPGLSRRSQAPSSWRANCRGDCECSAR